MSSQYCVPLASETDGMDIVTAAAATGDCPVEVDNIEPGFPDESDRIWTAQVLLPYPGPFIWTTTCFMVNDAAGVNAVATPGSPFMYQFGLEKFVLDWYFCTGAEEGDSSPSTLPKLPTTVPIVKPFRVPILPAEAPTRIPSMDLSVAVIYWIPFTSSEGMIKMVSDARAIPSRWT